MSYHLISALLEFYRLAFYLSTFYLFFSSLPSLHGVGKASEPRNSACRVSLDSFSHTPIEHDWYSEGHSFGAYCSAFISSLAMRLHSADGRLVVSYRNI